MPHSMRRRIMPALALLPLLLMGCGSSRSAGERLARANCAVCHAFPEPQLLARQTWQTGVLPQMAPHLGISTKSLFTEAHRSPDMTVLKRAISERDWEKIVGYYLQNAPDALPAQSLPATPQLDPAAFRTGPFVPRLQSSAIITLLHTDTLHHRIYVGEAASNWLRLFDWNRHLRALLTMGSPPTDVIIEADRVLVLESGILDPNDQPKGTLVQYHLIGDSLRLDRVVIDSLFRPVFVREMDFDHDGRNDFLICEYGDNKGRLALYHANGTGYDRQVLDASPGAIRFELHDLTGDGAPDIEALFAQGDERIVLFANDGTGKFTAPPRVLARFPPVYGSMHFSMADFNGDGKLDIVYVNGDNFDFSRVLKPYHGIRILENDGQNNFTERYFFPLYGAAQTAVADFDNDGDPDILATSNFADERHPERGILYLENSGHYRFQPYAFSAAAGNQWNVMTTGDFNGDGRVDAIVGAMYLQNITRGQRFNGRMLEMGKEPLLFFENRTR
ncbi:MAG: FG-GAP repeat domain-containing protein [Gemmatimonadales bacterium]